MKSYLTIGLSIIALLLSASAIGLTILSLGERKSSDTITARQITIVDSNGTAVLQLGEAPSLTETNGDFGLFHIDKSGSMRYFTGITRDGAGRIGLYTPFDKSKLLITARNSDSAKLEIVDNENRSLILGTEGNIGLRLQAPNEKGWAAFSLRGADNKPTLSVSSIIDAASHAPFAAESYRPFPEALLHLAQGSVTFREMRSANLYCNKAAPNDDLLFTFMLAGKVDGIFQKQDMNKKYTVIRKFYYTPKGDIEKTVYLKFSEDTTATNPVSKFEEATFTPPTDVTNYTRIDTQPPAKP